ncbi:hypothetical protein ACQKFU_23785 [Bacillus mycoides]|uniref:hypothetical protein n=1 Tax=Bacillus mycoides TaxID=1405 RepID=UPI003D023120
MCLTTKKSYNAVNYRKLSKREKEEYVSNLKSRNVWLGGVYIYFKTSSKHAVKNIKNALENGVDVTGCTEFIGKTGKKGDYEVTLYVEFKEQSRMNYMGLKVALEVFSDLVALFSLIHSRQVLLETYVFDVDDISCNASLSDKVVRIGESDLNGGQVTLAA